MSAAPNATQTTHSLFEASNSVGPAEPYSVFSHPLRGFFRESSRMIWKAWRWIEGKRTQQLATRRMRVSETVSLGEKRFVSVIQVDGTDFLIGGAVNQVHLLAVLEKDGHPNTGRQWRQAETRELLP